VQRFDEIWFSNPGVYEVRMCIAGVNRYWGELLIRSVGGGTARHCVDQQSGLFHYCSLGGDTARPDGLQARLCYAFLVNNLLLLFSL